MTAKSAERVTAHTPAKYNRRLRDQSNARVAYFASHPEEIEERLRELDREWDIERMLETNASSLAFIGIVLGARADRRWLLLPAMVTAFLFQHAVQGWCPPLPLLRRLGFRTVYEIEEERHALKALRGDYAGVVHARNRARVARQAASA
jgi:hypothetical protein